MTDVTEATQDATPPPPVRVEPPMLPEFRMPRRIDPTEVLGRLDPDSPLGRAFARVQALGPDEDGAERRRLEADAAEETRALRRRNLWAGYAASRPVDYIESSYERLHPQQNPERKVTGWWRSGARTLILAGRPGTGKTDSAYAICNEVASAARDGKSAPVTVRAWRVVDLAEALSPPSPHAARDENVSAARDRVAREVRECDLLLLDDLLAKKATDWWREVLYGVIEHRTSNPGRRTILTMNAAEKKALGATIEETCGSAIVSRLRKDTVSAWVDGDDLRRFAEWDPFAD